MSSRSKGWLIGMVILFPILVVIYNKVTVRKNDGAQYLRPYLKNIITLKVVVPKIGTEYNDKLGVEYSSYRAGASPIGFKGVNGQLMLISIFDSDSKKYFKIYLCDVDRQRSFSLADKLEGEEILVYVNKEDLNDLRYGTMKDPVPVFNFKGLNKKIAVESTDASNNLVMRSLEPTPPEYEHNVLVYLTYLMPKEQFISRFVKGR